MVEWWFAMQASWRHPTPDQRASERWLGKFGQQDKWTFCLTTAQDAESRREYEQTIPPEP